MVAAALGTCFILNSQAHPVGQQGGPTFCRRQTVSFGPAQKCPSACPAPPASRVLDLDFDLDFLLLMRRCLKEQRDQNKVQVHVRVHVQVEVQVACEIGPPRLRALQTCIRCKEEARRPKPPGWKVRRKELVLDLEAQLDLTRVLPRGRDLER